MWNGKDVSVVLMTFAERDSIREAIEGFFATGIVDEVVVDEAVSEASVTCRLNRRIEADVEILVKLPFPDPHQSWMPRQVSHGQALVEERH